MIYVYSIVEGHGEVQAVPLLVRRLFAEVAGRYDVFTFEPYRLSKDRILMKEHLFKALEVGKRKIQSEMSEAGDIGIILVMRDADDDCPVELQSKFRTLIHEYRFDGNIIFNVPNREFEAWFLASRDRLVDDPGIKDTAPEIAEPDSDSNPKAKFEREFVKNENYSETVDQTKYTSRIDLASTKSPSLKHLRDRCIRALG